jgi:hypothetical protein
MMTICTEIRRCFYLLCERPHHTLISADFEYGLKRDGVFLFHHKKTKLIIVNPQRDFTVDRTSIPAVDESSKTRNEAT